MKNNSALRTKQLSVLWIVSYILMAIVSSIYKHSRVLLGDMSYNEPASIYQIVTTSLVLIYFYPLLWRIHFYAKIAQNNRVLTIAKILIGLFSYWLICAFAMWIGNIL